jgi:hypothetical protein
VLTKCTAFQLARPRLTSRGPEPKTKTTPTIAVFKHVMFQLKSFSGLRTTTPCHFLPSFLSKMQNPCLPLPLGLQLESPCDSCQVHKREQETCLDCLYLQYESLSTLHPPGRYFSTTSPTELRFPLSNHCPDSLSSLSTSPKLNCLTRSEGSVVAPQTV